MRVRCLKNSEPDEIEPTTSIDHALSIGSTYEVIGIEAGDYRVLDDQGFPCLFAPDLFEVVDSSRPSHWVVNLEDGREYAYAPELNGPGFFEDYFDRKPEALRVFHRYINQHLRLNDVA